VNIYLKEYEITADYEETGDYYLCINTLIIVKQSNIFFHVAAGSKFPGRISKTVR